MSYFNPEFVQFFAELSKNNNVAWFFENRQTFDKEVRKPFTKFVKKMINNIKKYEFEINIKPPETIMPINKDIRFSADKTPYNTCMAANISASGKKDMSYPGFYIQLSAEGILLRGGAYVIENNKLNDIRKYMALHLDNFAAAYNEKSFVEKFGSIQGEQSNNIPPEFQAILDKEPLIGNKQFYYSAVLPPDIIASEELEDILMTYYLAGRKVNDFLKLAWLNM